MKKSLISILFFLVSLNYIDIPKISNVINTIYSCDIINMNIKSEIQEYIKRNFKNDNEKGVVVVKLSHSEHDTTNFEFYISEIIKKSKLRTTKLIAYSFINKRLVLFYGTWDLDFCTKGNNTFRKKVFEKYLINDDLKVKDKDNVKKAFILFDPEIIKIVVKNNSVVLKKELLNEPDLN